jgi:hypothetical protein
MNSLLVETRIKLTLYIPIVYWSGARHWDSISIFMVYSVEGAGEGNRPLALDTAVTLEP